MSDNNVKAYQSERHTETPSKIKLSKYIIIGGDGKE